MNKGKILLICLAGLFAASCAKDNVDQPVVDAPETAIAKKFVNTSSDAVAGKLLLYVDKEYVSKLEAAKSATDEAYKLPDDSSSLEKKEKLKNVQDNMNELLDAMAESF